MKQAFYKIDTSHLKQAFSMVSWMQNVQVPYDSSYIWIEFGHCNSKSNNCYVQNQHMENTEREDKLKPSILCIGAIITLFTSFSKLVKTFEYLWLIHLKVINSAMSLTSVESSECQILK